MRAVELKHLSKSIVESIENVLYVFLREEIIDLLPFVLLAASIRSCLFNVGLHRNSYLLLELLVFLGDDFFFLQYFLPILHHLRELHGESFLLLLKELLSFRFTLGWVACRLRFFRYLILLFLFFLLLLELVLANDSLILSLLKGLFCLLLGFLLLFHL